MKRYKHNRKSRLLRLSRKAGLAPGTPVFIGERKREQVQIGLIDYNATRVAEEPEVTLDECERLKGSSSVTWINVNGIHDTALIEALGKRFGLHALTFEDIVNTAQRPKVEQFENYLYVVLKMISWGEAEKDVKVEHVSLILGEGFVMSFLEDEGDVFDGVRARIRAGKGRIRGFGSDYLAYALMDAVVDQYFLVLEMLSEHTESIDEALLRSPTVEHIHEIHRIKHILLALRKSVWPLREEIGALEKSGSALLVDRTKPFFRDLYDHTIQIMDMVESQRDILGGMHDTYLASVSNRMNEVMKVLTVIATIFIPLTFVAGVYGMNFEHMPELEWRWGYPVVLALMAFVGGGMLWYFRRRKWF